MAALPSQIASANVNVLSMPQPVGTENVPQLLQETNVLLRAMVILLCNMNDVNFDDVITLATNNGSVFGLEV